MRRSAFRPLNKGLFNGLHGEVGVTTIDAVIFALSCKTGLYLKLVMKQAHRHLVSGHYASIKKHLAADCPFRIIHHTDTFYHTRVCYSLPVRCHYLTLVCLVFRVFPQFDGVAVAKVATTSNYF